VAGFMRDLYPDNKTLLSRGLGIDDGGLYALGGLEKKIFVAQYRLMLPSEQQIVRKLKEIKQ